jgi:MinD-like ATPase involved in chromosome partitioning or flagellar assembly
MAKIITIHSFRGGTGKSNTAANLAAILAGEGYRVGVVDTDIQSPGIHVLFHLNDDMMEQSLNDYLWGKCEIQDAAYNVTSQLDGVSGEVLVIPKGQLFLIPSSIHVGEIARVLRDGYDVNLLNEGLRKLITALKLDVLLIDTHPGLNEETMLSIAISDALLIVMRPDQQDYQGTGVTVEIARKLSVPRMFIVVNKVPAVFVLADVQARVEKTYRCEVAAVLPHSDEMLTLASEAVFAQRYPHHAITESLRKLAARLML